MCDDEVKGFNLNKISKFYVVNAFVGFLLLGSFFAWSVFVSPLEADFGWTRSQTSLNFSISIVTFSLGGLAAGGLLKTKTPRQVTFFSAACILAGFILSSRTQTLLELYLFYGVLFGFGVGVGYTVLISTILQWFPERQGFISGILLMGYGLGGSFFGNAAFSIMNAFGWRNTFTALGLILGGAIFLVGLNVKRPSSGQISRNTNALKSESDYRPGEMLHDWTFYAFYVRHVTAIAVGLSILGNAAPFANSVFRDPMLAAAIGGLASIFNGLGRVSVGFIFDKIGSRKTLLICTGGMFLGVLLLISAAISNSVILLVTGYAAGGFFYGSNVACAPGFVGKVYGLRDFAVNYGIFNTGPIFSSFVGPYALGILFTWTGSYVITHIMLLGLCCVGFAANVSIKKHYVPPARCSSN